MKMMKKTLLATALLASLGSVAQAEWTPSANVALTTDYVWRGVSQSDEDPAIQGGFDIGHSSGFAAGVWASNVDFDDASEDDADLELDIYASFSSEVNDKFGWDVGVIDYVYPGTSDSLDWVEVWAGVHWGPISGSINYSNDVFNSDETGIYYTVSAEHSLDMGIGFHGSVGYYDFDSKVTGQGNPNSYLDWSLGANYEYAGFGFDLTYFDTDSDGEDLFDDWADSRVVFSISKEM
jgi:uncharacterized protein (TIGR02001 family)